MADFDAYSSESVRYCEDQISLMLVSGIYQVWLTGESSCCKRVSTSTLQADSRPTTTRLNRSLSDLMAAVLASDTGREYKVSKVFKFCHENLLLS